MKKSLIVSLCLASSISAAQADPIRMGFDANTLFANDDGSTGEIALGFDVNFFGLMTDSLWVNNNGNVTFDGPLDTFTPFNLTSTGQQIIAPFFADVDTTGDGSSPVTYGTGMVDGRNAFAANFVDVGYFSSSDDLLNAFQVVIIDRSDLGVGDFDFEFNYEQILWETGDASDGVGGLGGFSARAGYSNGSGDPGTSFEITGSAINGAFLDGGPNALIDSTNIDEPGRFLFEVRNGLVNPEPDPDPDPDPDPVRISEPSTLALVGMGALLLAFQQRRRA
ncbi:MAG: nidogen-like domain-containing protein [Pseudomonadota bacterium]